MITETISNKEVSFTLRYQVQIEKEENSVYLILHSLQYECKHDGCKASTYVDLSLVPAHNVSLFCIQCGNIICDIPEEEFKRRLVPEDSLVCSV